MAFNLKKVLKALLLSSSQPLAMRGRRWLEQHGPRFLAPLAGAYLVKARKRVRSITPIRPAWTQRQVLVGSAPEPTTRQAA